MKNKIKLDQVKPDTIARTIILILALVNQGLAVVGKGTITVCENDVYQFVSLAWTAGASAYAWWKNNSFTNAAQAADEYMAALKEETINELQD